MKSHPRCSQWSLLPNDILVGREEELALLEHLYSQSLASISNSCSISSDKNDSSSSAKRSDGIDYSSIFCHLQGKPGVGKSALVKQFAYSKRRGLFFSYKFNQFGSGGGGGGGGTPMDAIVQCMTDLAHQTVSCPQYYSDVTEQRKFLQQLTSCETMRALVELVPAFGTMIQEGIKSDKASGSVKARSVSKARSGSNAATNSNKNGKLKSKQNNKRTSNSANNGNDDEDTDALILKAIPDGLAGDVKKILYPAIARALKAIRNFTKTPIVLFFDDVQWIDPASKAVLQYLVQETIPIFMIVAFRDKSSQSTFELESILLNNNSSCPARDSNTNDNKNSIETSNVQVVGLELSEFTKDHVSQLLSHLHLSPDDHQFLTEFLFQQTDGNPFYLRFRLSVMAESGALICCETSSPATSTSEATIAKESSSSSTTAIADTTTIRTTAQTTSSVRWKVDRELITLGMEMHSEDAIEFCLRVMKSLDPEIVAVLCRIALMPQGRTLSEYAEVFQGERVLEQLAQKANTDILGIIEKALAIGEKKSILYHHSYSGANYITATPTSQGSIGNSSNASNASRVYCFAHDRLQHAAAKCVSSDQEEAEIHFFLGKQRLLRNNTKQHKNGKIRERSNFRSSDDSSSKTERRSFLRSASSISARSNMVIDTVPEGADYSIGEEKDSFYDEDDMDRSHFLEEDFTATLKQKQPDMEAFEILHHFSKARNLITDPQLIVQIGELAAQASEHHVTAGSHEQFDAVLQFARDLLDTVLGDDQHQPAGEVEKGEACLGNENMDGLVSRSSSLKVQLLIAHHRIKFLMNDLKAAEDIFHSVEPRLSSPKEIRDAYFSRISLLINSQDHPAAIAAVGEALTRLNDESVPSDLVLPEGQPSGMLLGVTQKIKKIFEDHPNWSADQVANSIPISNDEDHNFRVEMMISIVASLYIVGRFDLYLFIPSVACDMILQKGLTRSSGHAFSVLGFALVAMFGDAFGAEIAMIGSHLVDRFDNPTCVCRALVLSGMSVIYDRRYENLAARQLYTSYVAGRTAHDLLWACYGVYILSCLLQFEGAALADMVDTLDELVAYAMNDGHQVLAQRGCRAILHTTEMLMTGKSAEGPVFHFTIPHDEICMLVPLIPFTHAASSILLLYFDDKLRIAWQVIQEALEKKLDQAAPGIPVVYSFHLYTVLVCHGILLSANEMDSIETEKREEGAADTVTTPLDMGLVSGISVTEEERKKLRKVMTASFEYLEQRSKMAPIFIPYAHLANGCILDILENRPWEALKELEKVEQSVTPQRRGKHCDLVATANLVSADIFRRQKLLSTQLMHKTKAISVLRKWGADYVADRLSHGMDMNETSEEAGDTGSIRSDHMILASEGSATSGATPLGSMTFDGHSHSQYSKGEHSKRLRDGQSGPNFAAILSTASRISSFTSFDELAENLSSALLVQATATRLLLFVRHPDSDSGKLEPTAECTSDGLSPEENLPNVQFSNSIVKITDLLKQSLVVHSAQQESPYCFESYIQESKVQSIASMPITYQDSVIAVVYLEHDSCQAVFTPIIMATMALLGQNVASAIVNARLLRDLRRRTVQLEQSHAFLAKALRVKDTILSSTSHELKTPLNGIIGLNEFLLDSDVELHPEVKGCAKTTLTMARQVLELVDDILDLSRLGEGKFQLHYETTALSPLVDEVFGLLKFSMGDNTSLFNKVDPAIEIMIDPARIKQALSNLISNAIKFTPEGTVTVTGEMMEENSMVVITVTDTGIGIDPAQLDVIFEPFFQVTSYETRQHQGTGLGLSITRQLVGLHGGRIDVVSKEGVGSSFQMYIPTTPPGRPSYNQTPTKLDNAPALQVPLGTPSTVSVVPTSEVVSTEQAEFSEQTILNGDAATLPSHDSQAENTKANGVQPLFAISGSNSAAETYKGTEARRPGATRPLFPTPATKSCQVNPLFPLEADPKPGEVRPLFATPGLSTFGSRTGEMVETKIQSQILRSDASVPTKGSVGNAEGELKSPSRSSDTNSLLAESDLSLAKHVAPSPGGVGAMVSRDSFGAEPLRVMAVDDTPLNLKVVTNFLRKANMIVSTATNGQELLDKLEGDQWMEYDIILLDWMMPLMDGISACRLLRKRIPSELLPVIFLTAKTDPDALPKGFEAGGTDFATKPLNGQAVVARTKCHGLASRRARARYFEAIPIAHAILTETPFWKLRSATGHKEMFVVCFRICCESTLSEHLDGPTFLRYFQHDDTTYGSDWKFCELEQDSVSFITFKTTTLEIQTYVRSLLSTWAEAQMLTSTSSITSPAKDKPMIITIGVDYLPIRVHLFGERQPMLAAVESCARTAQELANKASQHEEIIISESAEAAMKSNE